MVFHGAVSDGERGFPAPLGLGDMVALATICAKLVAKATNVSGSAGGSILARDEKCANFPRKKLMGYLGSHSGDDRGSGGLRRLCGRRILGSAIFLRCQGCGVAGVCGEPPERVNLCSICGLRLPYLCWRARACRCWLKTRLRPGVMLSGQSRWATRLFRWMSFGSSELATIWPGRSRASMTRHGARWT